LLQPPVFYSPPLIHPHALFRLSPQAADVKLKLLAKQAEQQRKALAAKGKEAGRLESELAGAQKKVDAVTAKLAALGFDAAEVEALEGARAEQVAAARAAKDAVEALAAKVRGARGVCARAA
jgi:hypothetical protein